MEEACLNFARLAELSLAWDERKKAMLQDWWKKGEDLFEEVGDLNKDVGWRLWKESSQDQFCFLIQTRMSLDSFSYSDFVVMKPNGLGIGKVRLFYPQPFLFFMMSILDPEFVSYKFVLIKFRIWKF
jgi:hypothetical protein